MIDSPKNQQPGPIGSVEEAKKQQHQQLMQMALRGPIPRYSANSCGVAQSPSDLALVFISNNNPVATVNMSYETAKLIITYLEEAIKKFEAAVGRKVEDYREIDKKMREVMEQENVKPM